MSLGKKNRINPIRVKINYDPSNKLEYWVEKNLKHEFYRKIEGGGWKKMYEEKQYIYDVSPVENSVKINIDGSKTQDFIFSYYIYEAKDASGNEYQFGFDKKYINVKDDSASYGMESGNAYMTYIKQDVGGGKKLFIDYDIDQDQILENYSNYTTAES